MGPVADVIKLQGGATAYFPEKEKVLILHFVGDGVDAISFFKLPSLAVQFYLLYGNLRVLEKKRKICQCRTEAMKKGEGVKNMVEPYWKWDQQKTCSKFANIQFKNFF